MANVTNVQGGLSASWSWDVLYFKGWQLAAVGGGWRRLMVGGPWGLSLRAVQNQKKFWVKDSPENVTPFYLRNNWSSRCS